MTTGLLVSVRDRSEALDALEAGADVIDFKEPRHGSLGAVDAATLYEAATAIAGRVPLSAALGELLDAPHYPEEPLIDLPVGIMWAKFGLAGCATRPEWGALLRRRFAALRRGVSGVAVAYADWRRANAPAPDEVLACAVDAGCRAVLVDTWHKATGSLVDLWTRDECAAFISRIHDAGLLAVVGGSLSAPSIEYLMPTQPDYFAVRGAVCVANDETAAIAGGKQPTLVRNGRIDPVRVSALAALVRENRPHVVREISGPLRVR